MVLPTLFKPLGEISYTSALYLLSENTSVSKGVVINLRPLLDKAKVHQN